MTLVETARLFALMNVSIHDALQTTLTSKFVYGVWRPVTAIRQADTDLNAATDPDPTWLPLHDDAAVPVVCRQHGDHRRQRRAGARNWRSARTTCAVRATWKQSGGQPDVTHTFSTLWRRREGAVGVADLRWHSLPLRPGGGPEGRQGSGGIRIRATS